MYQMLSHYVRSRIIFSTHPLTRLAVDTSLVFWSPEVKVDERAVFQLALSAPSDVHMSSLPFTSLAIYFSDDSPPMTVVYKATEDDSPAVQMVDLGCIEYPIVEHEGESKEIEANLRWQAGGTIVFRGTVTSRSPTVISVSCHLLKRLASNPCGAYRSPKLF